MDKEKIKQLIDDGESNSIEFKRSTAKLKGAAETLCAFLNGEDGLVFIGVSDDKSIVGQNVADHTKLEIANALKKFEPTANITVDYVAVAPDKFVIVLRTHSDPHCRPYSFDGRAYERKESETHVMSQSRYQQLLFARNVKPVSWETQIAYSFTLNDLDQEEIIRTVKDGVRANHIDASVDNNNVEQILTKLHLLEEGSLLNAAIVLFAKEPDRKYMQCTIRMARFKGLEKGDFIDSSHIFGHAFYLLREAENFIRRNTQVAGKVIEGQMQRVDEPEYPQKAVREALINALCHREYVTPGGAITLIIYDDRLEIINTGLLPEGITLNQLKEEHSSHPRNPRITNVFYRRGYIEEMGIGTQKITQLCVEAHMKEPEFFEEGGTFVVRLWSSNYVALHKEEEQQLTKRQKVILELLSVGELSPQEILAKLNESITDRTLRRDLQTLKEKGYIDTQGQLGPKTKWMLIKQS